MKRRTFGLLAGSSIFALNAGRPALAQRAPASILGAGLTPMGSEQAGNADNSIPAWTGGMTTLPAGLQPNDYVPEPFPDEQAVVVIDSSNMAGYAGMLAGCVMALMTKYGFKIKVYPTHRTAAMPQYVYDNIAKNHGNARFAKKDPVGGRFGFENAYGGVPFPVPDVSNPLVAGAQIMINHITNWRGFAYEVQSAAWIVSDGQKVLGDNATPSYYKWPYFDPKGSLATFDGRLDVQFFPFTGPENLVGQQNLGWFYTNTSTEPSSDWELLNGQGRVRRAPEVAFDTPSSEVNGICNYDEYFGFEGSMERYDWKYIGKQEMYIPYNNNRLYASPAEPAHLVHFLDPELVRWEKHRCWVVEATLHPGERNVRARRRFYVNEDTWTVAVVDAWDANNNLVTANFVYNCCRPDLPGTVYGNSSVHDLQTGDFATLGGPWNQKASPEWTFVQDIPYSKFDPANMAASAQY